MARFMSALRGACCIKRSLSTNNRARLLRKQEKLWACWPRAIWEADLSLTFTLRCHFCNYLLIT